MSGLQPADFAEPYVNAPWPNHDDAPAARARPKRSRPGPTFTVPRTTLPILPSLAAPLPVAEPQPVAPDGEAAIFEIGRIRPVRDGGRLIATAEVLIELRGEALIVDMQIMRWPDGRCEAQACPFWHPQFSWEGASLVPTTIRAAVAAEVVVRLAEGRPTVVHEKRCSICGAVQPAAAFRRKAETSDGLEPRCRACRVGATRQ